MDTTAGSEAPPPAGRREWLGLVVLALPTLLLSLDLSVLYLALPHLTADLQASSVEQLWIVDTYGFMVAGFLVTMGTLGDRIGRKRLLMIGAVIFGIASLAAAFAPNPGVLIAARVLMGIAGATIAPSTLGLISNMFLVPGQRGFAISVWMSCFMAGNAIGPIVGGVLLELSWWGSVFLLAIPVMVLLLVSGPVLLPENKAPQAGRLDPMSVGLSLATILPVIYGIKHLAKDGWDVIAVVAIVIGLACGVLFVRRQNGLSDPLLDIRLFHGRSFRAALNIMLIGGIFLGGTTLLVTQFLQLVAGKSPLQAGLLLLPSIAAMITGSMLAPVLTRRIRPAYVVTGGMLIAAVGYGVLTQVESSGAVAVLVAGWAITLGGNGFPAALNVNLVVGSAPPEKAGSAASVAQTCMELGLALGIAVVGSIGTAIYQGKMSGNLPPGVSPEAAEQAGGSLNAALSAGQAEPELVALAREAFTSGLNVAGGIAALISIGLGILSVVALRHVPPTGAGAEPAAEEPESGADSPKVATTNE